MITISGSGFVIDGQERTEYTGAPPITVEAGASAAAIRIVSDYPNVRNGGPSIAVQVDGYAPAILAPNRAMRINLRTGRSVTITEKK